MTTAYATVEEFRARVSARFVDDLTQTQPPNEPLTPEELDARIQRALDDITAEIEGYRPRIRSAYWPTGETRRAHAIKGAMYYLTLDRPGAEFEQIRNAYVDTIAFYKDLVLPDAAGGQPPIAATAFIPDAVFNDRSLKGLVP
jgi:phage gp36-like protein